MSETCPQFKCLAWDPQMTFVELQYEVDLSLYTWEMSLALKKLCKSLGMAIMAQVVVINHFT